MEPRLPIGKTYSNKFIGFMELDNCLRHWSLTSLDDFLESTFYTSSFHRRPWVTISEKLAKKNGGILVVVPSELL